MKGSPFLAICLVLALALALRLVAIGWGLPFFYAMDEEDIVGKALGYLTSGDWSPHKFAHPASTLRYLLAVLYAGLVWARTLLDPGFSAASLGEATRLWSSQDPSPFYTVGRLVTIGFALGTVLLAYLLGRRAYGAWVGGSAALFTAVYFLHVRLSVLATSDVPLGFFVLWVTWLALDIAQKGRWRDYLAAGIALGAGVATKYPAALAALPLLAGHLGHIRKASAARQASPARALADLATGLFSGRLWLCALISLVTFLALTPFLLPELHTAVAQIRAEFRGEHVGANRLPGLQNYIWYFREPLAWGYGWAFLILGGVGLVIALARLQEADLLLLSFALPFYGVIANGSLRWARWILPLVPFIALFAGIAFAHLSSRWIAPLVRRERLHPYLIGLVLAGLCLPAVHYDLREMRELALPSTQTQATRWVEANLPTGTRIVQESYTTAISPDRYVITKVGTLGEWPLAHYLHEGVEIAIASSRMYDRYFAEAERYAVIVRVYEDLFACGELLRQFAPIAGSVQGPTLRIYRLAPCAAARP